MSRTHDMTTGSITKQMTLFALPLILTNIGQQLYMIVDAAIVGRGVGVKALASVGSADWIYWLVLWTAGAFTTAFSTFVARSFGEKDFEKLNRTLAMSVILSAVLGIMLTFVGLLASRPVLELLKTPADIIDGAEVYLITMISGTMIVVAYNLAAAILRAFGDAKSPMIAMAISAVINIGLDLLFVLVFHWGIFGAAFASILSQLVSFVYCYFCIKKIEYVNVEKSMWKPDWEMIRELTMFAIPVSLETIVISLGGIILQATINDQGSIFVAGYTAVNKLYGLLECTAISLGVTFLTFFAQNYGAKEYDRVRRGMKSSIIISVIAASIVGGIALIFGRQLIGVFLDGSMEGALEAIEIAWRYLRFMAICMNILYLIYPYRKVLQGMGNAVWSMISGMIECVIRVGMGWLVAAGLSAEILYYIEPSAWLGALLFVAIPYYIVKKDYLK
ncbi:MAG: MATE family efflux transporter [Oscillospiraceae bacterium]|nr:MATE family efflux transporter [Oscillospiraceae bacterium]